MSFLVNPISVFHLITLFSFCATANSGTKRNESFSEMNFVVLGYKHSPSPKPSSINPQKYFFTLSLHVMNTPQKLAKQRSRSASSAKRENLIDLLTFLSSYSLFGADERQIREQNASVTHRARLPTFTNKRTVIPRCSPTRAIVFFSSLRSHC